MFSSAPARGEESSAEDQRVGPGSYKQLTTLTPKHPTIECSWSAKFSHEERMRVPRDAGEGPDPDPERVCNAVTRIISTSRKPPQVKFGKQDARPDYGSASATKNTRFMTPNGQVGQKQSESSRKTAPSASLSGRCKLSGNQVQAGIGTPGPEYTLPELMGNAPLPAWGSSARTSQADAAEDTPGPGSYSKPNSIGKQTESRLRSSSSARLVGGGRTSFGSAFGMKSNITPSPAKYKPENCRNATSKGVPKISFAQKLIDPTMVGQSEGSRVGPGSYKILTTLTPKHPTIECSWSAKMGLAKRPDMSLPGSDIAPHDYTPKFHTLSTSTSSPTVGFAKGPRGENFSASNVTPSPAKYDVSSVNMGNLTGYLNAPSASLSGRTKFGSF